MARHATGVDRVDAEMLSSTYWPDAHDVHGDCEGTGEEFVTSVIPRLKKLVRTQYYSGNALIRIDVRFAKIQSFTQNWHMLRRADGALYDVVQGGR